MGYREAIEAAGAEVLDTEMIGDYDGMYFMVVRYNGVVGYVQFYYGSCSGCDAYEEFECSHGGHPTVEEMADFGQPYLKNIYTLADGCLMCKHFWGEELDQFEAFLERTKHLVTV